MSKNQKNTIKIPVETVENLRKKIEWISTTISFWHLEKCWPMNLIKDICDNMYDELKTNYLQDYKCVSVSHIMDK